MKIAFPLKNEKDLANDFSEALFIGIYDDIQERIEYFTISTINNQIGMACFFDVMATRGLKAVISPYYNFLSVRVFKESRIEPHKAKGYNLIDNIKYYFNLELKPFELNESFEVAECSSDCRNCNSSCFMY